MSTNSTPTDDTPRYYTNDKVRARLETFFNAKTNVSVQNVRVKVVFTFDPSTRMKETLLSVQRSETLSQFSNAKIDDIVSSLQHTQRSWDEFGIESFSASWSCSFLFFLKVVPKHSILMQSLPLIPNFQPTQLPTQKISENKNRESKGQETQTFSSSGITKRSKKFVPTTAIGEPISDLLLQTNVEKHTRAHIRSHYHLNDKTVSSCKGVIAQIPSFKCIREDVVWTSVKPTLVSITQPLEKPTNIHDTNSSSAQNYVLKIITFLVTRQEQRVLKCTMISPTFTPPTIGDVGGLPEKRCAVFEAAINTHKYEETRYIHVDLTRLHIKVTNNDLLCFISLLEEESSTPKEAEWSEPSHVASYGSYGSDVFTSMNYLVSSYLLDYLGLTVFKRGWENAR